MEAFDKNLITGLLAQPQFQQNFGSQLPDGTWEIPSTWQAGLTNGALVGEILGLILLNGLVADRWGYRKTLLGALLITTILISVIFFAKTLVQLLMGFIFLGVPWGVFQTLTVTYAGDVCPPPPPPLSMGGGGLRPYLTTYVNLCWVMGQFFASGVLKAVSQREDQWAYRIPYALQWIWPIPLMVGIYFAPESPWWLVRMERYDEAKSMLMRLTSSSSSSSSSSSDCSSSSSHAGFGFGFEADADEAIAQIKQTNDFEKFVGEGTSYLDCFRGTNLRRTEITCGVWLVQSMCGANFIGYSTYFYRQAGLNVSDSFTLSLAQYALGAIGVFVSWFLMPHVGRRQLYIIGQLSLFFTLVVVGFCGLASGGNTSAIQWTIGSMLLLFTFIYNCTVGPVCYALVAEMPSTRLRQKTVVLARSVFQIGGMLANILTTRQLNPDGWNWGPCSAFFWAGTGFVMLVWSFLRLPEPKGRTYAELDVLFEMRVSARLFRTTVVNTEEQLTAVVDKFLAVDKPGEQKVSN